MTKIKLNLGCGDNYRPGYINIDKYNSLVADKICDIEDLPFKSNSVDLIEANQLIEHFDYIHSKYILSEWFRILKPGCKLILETPNLEKTYKKLISEDIPSQKITLQWIYGIDSEGYQHKTGFTFKILQAILEEIGFEEISEEEQKTHLYENGLRVVCKKTDNSIKQFLAGFRKRLKNQLDIDDSYVLIPLENWLKGAFNIYEKNENNKEKLVNILVSKLVICNPLIPLIFIEEGVEKSIFNASNLEEVKSFLKKLYENQFHIKLYSLWAKSKKNLGGFDSDFQEFIDRIQDLIVKCLNQIDDCGERLSYIFNLKSYNFIIFDIEFIIQKAIQNFNLGVKNFHLKQYKEAFEYFQLSHRLYPNQFLTYWNLARLGGILEFNDIKIMRYYNDSLELAKNSEDIEKLEKEIYQFKNKKKDLDNREPMEYLNF